MDELVLLWTVKEVLPLGSAGPLVVPTVHVVAAVMLVAHWVDRAVWLQSSARRSYAPDVTSKAREAPLAIVSVEPSQSAPHVVSVVGEMYT
jgi:hypothetical protein